jgi:hypothetical protein
MTLELGVCMENAVCRRVVSGSIHSIGTSLVERSLHILISCPLVAVDKFQTYGKPHIPRLRACDGDHCDVVCVRSVPMFLKMALLPR